MELFIKYVCRATVFLFISGFEIQSHIACDVFVFHRSCIWNARDGGRRWQTESWLLFVLLIECVWNC